jgi:hypothetical protein
MEFVQSRLFVGKLRLVMGNQRMTCFSLCRRLAKIAAAMAGVRVVDAPRDIQSFAYSWHLRLTKEPAHEWFREQLRSTVRTI